MGSPRDVAQNAGVTDDNSVVALGSKVIDGLKSSPALLALIVMNAIFMAAAFWSIKQEPHMEYELSKMDKQLLSDTARLLATCDRGMSETRN